MSWKLEEQIQQDVYYTIESTSANDPLRNIQPMENLKRNEKYFWYTRRLYDSAPYWMNPYFRNPFV